MLDLYNMEGGWKVEKWEGLGPVPGRKICKDPLNENDVITECGGK